MLPKPFPKRWLLWLPAAGLAAAGFSVAASMALADRAPLMVLNAVPRNGLAFASASDRLLRSQMADAGGQFPTEVDRQAVEFARKAFLSEPLANDGLRTLAIDFWNRGEEERSMALLEQIETITRRDNVAQLWQAQRSLARGNLDSALRSFDLVLRTSSSGARGALLPQVVALLENDELVEPLAQLLEDRPPYEIWFWRALVRQPAVASNAAALRRKVGLPDDEMRAEFDPQLLENLLQVGDFEAAEAFYGFLTGEKAIAEDIRQGRVLLDGEAVGSPFELSVIPSGEFVPALDSDGQALLVSALPRAYGIFARRLLALEPGRYRLVDGTERDMRSHYSVDIGCAKAGGPLAAESHISNSFDIDEEGYFVVRSAQCEYQWLEFRLDNPASRDAVDLRLVGLGIRPA